VGSCPLRSYIDTSESRKKSSSCTFNDCICRS
jgi:hypothetical protein